MVGRTGLRAFFLGLILLGAPVMAHPASRHATVVRTDAKGEVRLDVTVRGEGPLVVLIPSLGRGASDFDDLATRLAAAGYEAAAIDPRGIGASTGPMENLTLADYAADVAAVAEKLSPRPAVLIGHAFGNRVARATAADHPEAVSGLILLAAGGQVAPAPDVAKALAEVFDTTVSPAQHRADVQKAFFAPGNDPGVWLDGWHPAAQRAQSAAVRATGADAWQGGGRADVLIVQASDDLVAPPANAEVLARAHPDRVRVVILPHAGHAMLPEQPDEIARIVIAYLRAHR